MNFDLWLENKISIVEKGLKDNLKKENNMQSIIYDAMEYSLMGGGKRLRPVIMLGINEMLGGNQADVLPFACAMEMIHTYSLIHDDLPAMDNDDYRRGRLSNHKKFNEAIAILAGDALLNKAFEIMTKEAIENNINSNIALKVINLIANSSGTEGMIGGQVVDIFCEKSINDTNDLEYLHSHKTGAIIKSSALAGAMLAGANDNQIKLINEFAENLGLAFQIQDDILDVVGDKEKLGKSTGNDANNNKTTYVTLLGVKGADELQRKLTAKAIEALKQFGNQSSMLIALCERLLTREK